MSYAEAVHFAEEAAHKEGRDYVVTATDADVWNRYSYMPTEEAEAGDGYTIEHHVSPSDFLAYLAV